MKKKYIIISIIALILIIGAVVRSKSGKSALSVDIEAAEIRNITETVTANGKVQPVSEVKISSDVSGEIVALNIQEGDEVKKGDILAKINPDLYISAQERTAAAVNTAKANLANAKARFSQAKAQFINNEASFKRNQSLFKDGAISESEFDAAKASYEVAKAEMEAAEQSIVASDFSVQSAFATLKEANDNLSRTTIFSPVSGTVSMLNVEKGERVVGTLQMTGTEMMRIANLKEMEVKVDVNENDIIRVHLGDTALIEVDAFSQRKFSGIVTQIANSARTLGVSADQVTNFEVKIRILQSSYKDLLDAKNPHLSPFRPGMTASVEILTKTVENVISVPIQAVTVRPDTANENSKFNLSVKNDQEMKECVFVYDTETQTAKIHFVKTGIQDSKQIEILSGIKEGQKIISGPYGMVSKELQNGSKVQLKEPETIPNKEKK
jgi:HlyD family secretion protein